MTRPRGVKSFAEIRELPYPEERVPAYATLLELILRDLYVEPGSTLSLSELIELHTERFRDVRGVYFANRVRNDLVHAVGEFSNAEWTKADRILEGALLEVTKYLPAEDQYEIWGLDAGGHSSVLRRIELKQLITSGNVVWPGEVAYSDRFTEDAATRFFSHFTEHTFSFESEVKSIYIHLARERLPAHSYVEGFLHSRTIDEIKLRGAWPDPIGDIRLECGGGLADPVVTVASRL
jgi:hypothetical protein